MAESPASVTSHEPRYLPFCRAMSTHGEVTHADTKRACDCPCHGGTAPWWYQQGSGK